MWHLLDGGAYYDLSVNCAALIRELTLFEVRSLLEKIWYFLKLIVNKTDTERLVKQDKSKTSNYTRNLPTAQINDCLKVKVRDI